MRFLTTFQLHDFIDTLVSLIAAFVLGTLIGAERQHRQRTAGLRTNVLVAVGAAAFVDLAMRLTGAATSARERDKSYSAERAVVGSDLLFQARGHP
jgi:putative Mg2+ transporter-C (MgtC) family protein